MSQAKVDRYKEEKRNRAKIMAKQKRENLMITPGLGGEVKHRHGFAPFREHFREASADAREAPADSFRYFSWLRC